MIKRAFGSIGALLAGAGLALGQSAPEFRPATGYRLPGAPSPATPMPGAAPPAAPPVWSMPAAAAPAPKRYHATTYQPPPAVSAGEGVECPAEVLAPPGPPVFDLGGPVFHGAPPFLAPGADDHEVPTPAGPHHPAGSAGPRAWAAIEALHWYVKDGPLVPLVTTGAGLSDGSLGAAGTTVLFGDQNLDFEGQFGGRATAGLWVTPCWGVEGVGLILEEGDDRFAASSDASGSPLLSRPIINTLTGREAIAQVSAPGLLAGDVFAAATTQLWGAEVNVLRNTFRGPAVGLNLLAGFRYLDLDEELLVGQTTRLLGGTAGFAGAAVTAPGVLSLSDSFDARNQFYGGQLGFQSGVQGERWFVGVTGKVALGVNRQRLDVGGATTLTGLGDPMTVPGGLLALPSGSGRLEESDLAFIPEGHLEIGLRVTPNISATVGYTFLYWNKVARPGDQLTRLVNPAEVPSSALFGTMPVTGGRAIQDSEFWAHGLSLGLAVRY